MLGCCCTSCVSDGNKSCPLVNALKDVDLLNEEIDDLQHKVNNLETERRDNGK